MIFFSFFVLIIMTLIELAVFAVIIMQVIAVFTTDAPFVSIPDGIEADIISALALSSSSVLYDLGCGDGRILRAATLSVPGITATGIEKGWWPYLLARFRSRGFPTITIRREDIFKTNTSNATHIFLYLYPQVVSRLMPILRRTCAPGTRIVSCDFECAELAPTEIIPIKSENVYRGKKLFVYVL